MRKYYIALFLSPLVGLLFDSCSSGPTSIDIVRDVNSLCPFSNKVSLSEAYEMASISTKSGIKDISVEPVIDMDGDTLMFFVNYSNGWKILSADKRTPVLIASSEVGSISLDTDNINLLAWLEMTAADMKHIIHLEDNELNFSSEEIFSHRQEWAKSFSKEPLRFPPDSLPIIFEGEWELVGTTTQEVYYDHVNHIIPAHWHQNSPYNDYCPPKTSGNGNQPVGCSPLACGQLLQFLCSHFEMQFFFNHYGISGDINLVSVPDETENNSTTALLLRFIGQELNAIYTDSYTTVVFAPTQIKNFYSDLHISCTKQTYSADKVKQNLSNGLPVLVSGYSGTILGLPNYDYGHTFIIDGYRRFRTMYLDHYQRISGNPPLIEERTDTSYSSPHISEIKMNWGWATQWCGAPVNDGWFALTGDWYVDTDYDFIVDESFTEDMTILCDFASAWYQ